MVKMPIQSPKIFVIAGLPRSGTTFLYYTLIQHPNIFVPILKEAHYFSYRNDYDFKWFLNLFANQSLNQIGMDTSPAYIFDHDAAKRIYEYDPTTKVIISLRRPSDMVCSLYRQQRHLFYHMAPFEQFIEHTKIGRSDNKLSVNFTENIISKGVQNFMDVMGENLLLINFTKARNDTLGMIQIIEQFLGLTPFFNQTTFQNQIINASDRVNSKFIGNLLTQEIILKSVVKYKWLQSMAWWTKVLIFRKMNKPKSNVAYHPPENELRLAREKLKQEDAWVNDLFMDNNYILGTGKPVKKLD